MMNKRITLIAVIALLTAFAACKKDDDDVPTPTPVNEEEVITSVILNFTDMSGVEPNKTVSFRDPDGEGGNDPTQMDTIRLSDTTMYHVHILLLNETETPADTISNEVEEEADEHLFCFEPTGADVTITRTDTDGTYEVGLHSNWVTGNASFGTVTVSLKHQPDGTKNGTCAPGETDIEVSFVTEIQ